MAVVRHPDDVFGSSELHGGAGIAGGAAEAALGIHDISRPDPGAVVAGTVGRAVDNRPRPGAGKVADAKDEFLAAHCCGWWVGWVCGVRWFFFLGKLS